LTIDGIRSKRVIIREVTTSAEAARAKYLTISLIRR
jgi:hypothetical protein